MCSPAVDKLNRIRKVAAAMRPLESSNWFMYLFQFSIRLCVFLHCIVLPIIRFTVQKFQLL